MSRPEPRRWARPEESVSGSGAAGLAQQGLWPELPARPEVFGAAKRIELKVIVPASHHGAVLAALDLDRRRTRARQVYYLDTPEHALSHVGVIVRARRIDRGLDDLVVKLRHAVRPGPPTEQLRDGRPPGAGSRGWVVTLPPRVRRSPDLQVEFDALPAALWWSASLKRTLKPAVLAAAVAGRSGVATLFSAAQQDLFCAHAGGVDPDELVVHGPVEVARTPTGRAGPGNSRLMVETWDYPDRSRLLELSARCSPAHATQVGADIEEFLTARGVTALGHQPTKTRASLDYFR